MATVPRLKRWRERRTLTMEELARRAGVGRATIYRIEHGADAQLSTVRKLATALDVDPVELLGDEPERSRPAREE